MLEKVIDFIIYAMFLPFNLARNKSKKVKILAVIGGLIYCPLSVTLLTFPLTVLVLLFTIEQYINE